MAVGSLSSMAGGTATPGNLSGMKTLHLNNQMGPHSVLHYKAYSECLAFFLSRPLRKNSDNFPNLPFRMFFPILHRF